MYRTFFLQFSNGIKKRFVCAAFEMKSINMLGNGILAPFLSAISVD